MAKQYDVLLRLLLLGDSGVGKTCLLCRFTDNECHSSHISTIGVDFKMKTLKIDGIKVRVQIWDTAGQERYQTITKQYYRRAQFALDKVQRILVGNKADEEQKRKVPKEQGNKLAKTYGMEFFETSACTNCNINESFTRLTELVLHAHKKEMDAFQGSINKYLDMTYLEGEQDKQDNSQKACAC
ncbi:ras-related protein Rab-15-like isoform 2-T2 [Salvelinus alpinus]|uniref:ras-related protein Rab-15-like isoform X2 n=1 Tax=Salvelinus alpinus TaxID=8036 RepID=UPI0039FC36CB